LPGVVDLGELLVTTREVPKSIQIIGDVRFGEGRFDTT